MATESDVTAHGEQDRTSQRGQTRRDQILEAATALLLDEGHAGFSVRGVAARAGLRLSHVQYYFPTPAGIIGTLLDRFIERYSSDALSRFQGTPGSAAERLTATLEFLFENETYRDQCAVFMTEVAAIAQRDEQIAAALARYYDTYRTALDAVACELAPQLNARQRAQRVAQCVALIEGTAVTRRHLGTAVESAFTARSLAQAIGLLLAGTR